ncbi:Hypothetical Protein FCC1311_003622 [Hondaea fermentalgiana]|uniref:Uncharacterized protein n=1 Tax=Hondaea fermentalgiana TaxID=2315210 RepID=A0A2R5G908_9STRA|nr:Hypothetical Protein FCC1311_003622 [Hondaea fermentalgiana]|eukprot:GBG24144.1 Hypothetical Protein FCC1311_003622 [Hondaea fermentalgiana]
MGGALSVAGVLGATYAALTVTNPVLLVLTESIDGEFDDINVILRGLVTVVFNKIFAPGLWPWSLALAAVQVALGLDMLPSMDVPHAEHVAFGIRVVERLVEEAVDGPVETWVWESEGDAEGGGGGGGGDAPMDLSDTTEAAEGSCAVRGPDTKVLEDEAIAAKPDRLRGRSEGAYEFECRVLISAEAQSSGLVMAECVETLRRDPLPAVEGLRRC